jgi:hypothetical protein
MRGAHATPIGENNVNILNRLANRESLVFVAIVASAATLHVRQHVADPDTSAAQAAPAYSGASECAACAPLAADAGEPRMLPADCPIRATLRPIHPAAFWV